MPGPSYRSPLRNQRHPEFQLMAEKTYYNSKFLKMLWVKNLHSAVLTKFHFFCGCLEPSL